MTPQPEKPNKLALHTRLRVDWCEKSSLSENSPEEIFLGFDLAQEKRLEPQLKDVITNSS